MKTTKLMLLVFLPVASIAEAQQIKEWVNQKKTQTEYLIQQVAANQIYLEYLKKGYRIALDGLNTVSTFKHGELNLHSSFFQSLKAVNPEVKQYAGVKETVELQKKIMLDYQQLWRSFQMSAAFSSVELTYIRRVFERLLDDCGLLLDELMALMSHEKLEMKDDQRLSRVNQLLADMQDKYAFSQSFAAEAKLLAASRRQEKNEVRTSHGLHGINN